MTDKEAEIREQGYEAGTKAVWNSLLLDAIRNLNGEELSKERMLTERAAVVAYLRSVCAEYGDNNWEDNLHLSDVIEKHLMRHLYPKLESGD